MPSSDRKLLSTPSTGKTEVLAALLEQHAVPGGRTVTPTRLKRAFYTRVKSADIQTVLTALVATLDVSNPSGSNYRLTTAGVLNARKRPFPRRIPSVV